MLRLFKSCEPPKSPEHSTASVSVATFRARGGVETWADVGEVTSVRFRPQPHTWGSGYRTFVPSAGGSVGRPSLWMVSGERLKGEANATCGGGTGDGQGGDGPSA